MTTTECHPCIYHSRGCPWSLALGDQGIHELRQSLNEAKNLRLHLFVFIETE